MYRTSSRLKLVAFVVVALLFMTGCSLIGGGGRAGDNDAITEGADFGRAVMAEGVGAGNRPVGVTNRFDSSQDYIYVVLEADYIEAGTTMFARWYRDGEPFEDSPQLVADRNYSDTYVEFHLENLRNRMERGNYSVEIFVNGNPVVEQEFRVN
ncbi:MAG TPA: hypothetical protein VLC52_11105 [Anaerolineae bacterium]|nr:hypothetical protein [Anaerolineae bacterium]